MKNKVILVTGGCGYIGSHTIVDLLEHGYHVICVDDLRNASKEVSKKIEKITGQKIIHYPVDVCDKRKMESIFTKHQDIDAIIHFAAEKFVGESTEVPVKYYENNISAITTLLHCVEKFKVRHFVFSSSCSVYGNPQKLPVTEETPYGKAESPYALTKQIGEMMLRNYSEHKPLDIVILRYFNPAGAHPSAMIGEKPLRPQNLVPLIIKASMENKPIQVFGSDYPTRDGSCIRDFIHVCDLAQAHRLSLDYLFKNFRKSRTQKPAIFNVGTGRGTTVKETLKAFEQATKRTLHIKLSPRRKGDVVAIYANRTKAKKELGWQATYTMKDIMQTAWNYATKK